MKLKASRRLDPHLFSLLFRSSLNLKSCFFKLFFFFIYVLVLYDIIYIYILYSVL